MSATSAPFGFRPAYHPTGLDRASKYTILASYNTVLYKGVPVILNTNGTLNITTGSDDLLGVFAGVEYTDANGKPNIQNYWPGQVTSGTNIQAYVWDDPDNIYEVQADGSVAQAGVGDQTNTTNISAGSALTGLSQCTVSSTLAGAGVQAQWRIVGFGQQVNNAPGDAFTIVQVKTARNQFVSNKVAV